MSIIEKINTGYRVWDVNEKDFLIFESTEDKIKFLLNYAVLAPSSHNTQPWKFKLNKNELEIIPDFSRHLIQSDKDKRMIYISLGCCFANIKIVAKYFGLESEVSYTNNLIIESAVKIIFQVSNLTDRTRSTEMFNAIKNRRTNRFFYKDTLVADEVLEELKKLNNFEEIKINFIAGEKLKSEIAEIMGGGMKRIISQKSFRKELAAWLRMNLTLKRDGMPGNGHKMNLLTSIIAPYVLRNIDVSEVEKEKAIKRVLNFPAIGIITSKEDSILNFIYTGEILEKLSLAIKLREMDIAIMVAIIEDKESRKNLQNILKTDFLPQMFFGFGFAEHTAPKSPRRDLKEFLID